MTIRVPRRSTIALATAGALASTGTAYLGARNLLVGQASHARTVIPKSWDIPPRADGVYAPGGGPVQRWHRGMPVDLHLMIFGDSTATGYGCMTAEEVPGVQIARGLAERAGKLVRLSTKAIVGATSRGVCGQVDAMFVAGPPPDAAVMMLGANDVTALNGISQSAQRLALAVRKLRARGAVVVVGTCPDLGMISAIPQLLAHEFRAAPAAMFSADGFHPSAIAYALAAEALLLALCEALGVNVETTLPDEVPAPADAPVHGQGHARLSGMSRLWRRPEPGLPAPSSSQPVAAD